MSPFAPRTIGLLSGVLTPAREDEFATPLAP
jgi:hypothetical protein